MPSRFEERDDSQYQLPPNEVVEIIDADPEPAVNFSPDTGWMLMLHRRAMPDLEDISRRMLRLGGIRVDPAANSRFETDFGTGLSIRARENEEEITIPIPSGAKINGTSWNHDSTKFIYLLVTPQGQQLWCSTVADPTNPRMLTDRLCTIVGGLSWMPDGESLLCRLVPDNRGVEPINDSTPIGPNIQESIEHTSPTRTYQDLLSNPHDEALFEYYGKTQLAIVSLDGDIRYLGKPGIYMTAQTSPNGEFVIVNTIKRPFSYLLPYPSFPQSIEVWEIESGRIVYSIAEVPMAENIPIEGVRTGPRNVEWNSAAPATLVWMEALDNGDPNQQADFRDRIMVCPAPFDNEPTELLKQQFRSLGINYFSDPNLFTAAEYDRERRWIRSFLHNIAQPNAEPKLLVDRSVNDQYGNPGSMVTVRNERGHWIVRQDGNWIYRIGRGATDEGDLPFIDRQDLSSLETERLWQCEPGTFEGVVELANSSADAKPQVITSSETPSTPSNYHLLDLNSDEKIQLTSFPDPTPQIREIKKELVTYERSDGVTLSATLYLPANYVEGTRLPLLVWAYPQEYNDARTAAQVTGSPSRFTRMYSITHLTLLTQGYAIMDSATMPIVGDPETMNDTFIEQVVASGKAAIDKAVEMGVADPDRVGIGGHSYGAFMTANLLAHSDLFKAGIARSGAYNRTLTPFGFQSERRSLWNAKHIYNHISPFMHADKIKAPLLLIHGEQDNNSGTFPMQSKRMYQAIKGNGGTVRLVMLPYESHNYRARESVLHTQAEMIRWLDKYVKNSDAP